MARLARGSEARTSAAQALQLKRPQAEEAKSAEEDAEAEDVPLEEAATESPPGSEASEAAEASDSQATSEADADTKGSADLVDVVLQELLGGGSEESEEERENRLKEQAAQQEEVNEYFDGCFEYLTPWHFFGAWQDTIGNSIEVVFLDAYQHRLLVTLSRPPRRDITLVLQSTEDGYGWCCGDATLDVMNSSSEKLLWVFGDGRLSTWTKPEGTQSAAKRWPVNWEEGDRGLEIADRLMPGFLRPMVPQIGYVLMAPVWVPVEATDN
eukprot:TRINITY_DN14801_c0_g1_i2.p1 TRINITY_DN14801_c0_g1~~TRINITY_DN14801_c0_g1_i2.p1  ORF type:complete len:292 (-),score=63.36 TRINITY_DN14801_c0_g1_i2:214-1017(-)